MEVFLFLWVLVQQPAACQLHDCQLTANSIGAKLKDLCSPPIEGQWATCHMIKIIPFQMRTRERWTSLWQTCKLEDLEVHIDNIAQMGHWAHGKMHTYYLSKLDVPGAFAMSGFYNMPYDLKRDSLTPPLDLQWLIVPWIEGQYVVMMWPAGRLHVTRSWKKSWDICSNHCKCVFLGQPLWSSTMETGRGNWQTYPFPLWYF